MWNQLGAIDGKPWTDKSADFPKSSSNGQTLVRPTIASILKCGWYKANFSLWLMSGQFALLKCSKETASCANSGVKLLKLWTLYFDEKNSTHKDNGRCIFSPLRGRTCKSCVWAQVLCTTTSVIFFPWVSNKLSFVLDASSCFFWSVSMSSWPWLCTWFRWCYTPRQRL